MTRYIAMAIAAGVVILVGAALRPTLPPTTCNGITEAAMKAIAEMHDASAEVAVQAAILGYKCQASGVSLDDCVSQVRRIVEGSAI